MLSLGKVGKNPLCALSGSRGYGGGVHMVNTVKRVIIVFLFLMRIHPVDSQAIKSMDFRNQTITDVLMVLANAAGQSVIVDETVIGTATFHFSDSTFEEALYRFTDACNLFTEKRNNAYYISKIQIQKNADLISIRADNTDIEMVVKAVGRNAGKTILYDQLPRATINLNSENITLPNLLEIIIKKYPEYSLVEENSAYYLKRAVEVSSGAPGRLSNSSITVTANNLYTMSVQRASFSAILTLLFRTGKREYSLLQRIDSTLDNLYFQDKPFDEMLRLVLEQANCDYVQSGDIYYVFEVQRRDILKKLKNVMVIQLRNIPVENATALLPNEYAGSSFMKADKNTNSVYLTGSTEEIAPIAAFFELLDVPAEGKSFKRFEIQYLAVKDFTGLLPQELAAAGPQIIPGSNAFIVQTTDEMAKQFEDYIKLIDQRNTGFPVQLRYIKSDELMQYLPPSVSKEELALSSDPTLVFYRGTGEKHRQFLEHLKLIDQPKPQIRYQMLVMQYQRSNNINWSKSLKVAQSDADLGTVVTGTFSNLVNINFDIITEFGYQMALQLNLQIGEDKAKVLADTTLNGISGQDIKFENTSTFRYRDTAIDPDTGKPVYTGVTREINSGLRLSINGWVSGDGMITMNVNATVSKQDESGAGASANTNPPPTSERVVNTQVRTKSGTPIVIGGLLQVDRVESVKKLPLLGSIPLIGKLFQDIDIQDSTTEMVIYIVPFVHLGEAYSTDYGKKNAYYYQKYILRDG
jgi:type II secretory pathway component GspD/PulD (secretin)